MENKNATYNEDVAAIEVIANKGNITVLDLLEVALRLNEPQMNLPPIAKHIELQLERSGINVEVRRKLTKLSAEVTDSALRNCAEMIESTITAHNIVEGFE